MPSPKRAFRLPGRLRLLACPGLRGFDALADLTCARPTEQRLEEIVLQVGRVEARDLAEGVVGKTTLRCLNFSVLRSLFGSSVSLSIETTRRVRWMASSRSGPRAACSRTSCSRLLVGGDGFIGSSRSDRSCNELRPSDGERVGLRFQSEGHEYLLLESEHVLRPIGRCS